MLSTYHEWRRHRTIRLGAGLAYYGLFALVPLIALSLAIAGFFFAEAEVQEYLTELLADFLGADSDVVADVVGSSVTSTASITGFGVLGLASLLVTASLLFLALQDALNTIWERPVRTGVRQSILRRGISFAVVLACGAVLVVSFALNSITALISTLAPDVRVWVPVTELIGTAASWLLGIGAIALLFQYLTDVRTPWPSVLLGATVTALLVAVGTAAIGAYLRRFGASSLLGATGGVFVVLLWIYYEAQIVLVGAELTRVLAVAPEPGG